MLVFSSSNTSDKKVLIFHCFGLFLEKSFDFSLFLKVYEGMQGCPFIEEASYKLLIETLLCVEDKDDARKGGVVETSSAITTTIGITEINLIGWTQLSC
jgi:hypothetical protein